MGEKVLGSILNLKLEIRKKEIAWNVIGENLIFSVLPEDKTYIFNETAKMIIEEMILNSPTTIDKIFNQIKIKFPDIEVKQILEDILSFVYTLFKNKIVYFPNKQEEKSFIKIIKIKDSININTVRSPYEFLPTISKSQLDFIPIDVHFDITYRCNLNCVHCYLGTQKGYKREEINISDVIKILNELKKIGTFSLTFSGGEPFMKEEFLSIVRFAREKGFKVNIISNGTLLTEQTINELNNLCVYINISLYGNKQNVHESITGVNGSFLKTWNAIKILRNTNAKFKVKILVMKQNVEDISYLINSIQKKNIDYEIHSGILPDFSRNLDVVNECQVSTSHIFKKLNSYFKNNIEQYKKENWTPICYAGRQRLGIDPFGNVYPCNLLRFNCGNMLKEDIFEIWYNSPIMNFIRMLTKEQFNYCNDCEAKQFCFFCMAVNFLKTKNIFLPADTTCSFSKGLANFSGIKKGSGEIKLKDKQTIKRR